MLLGEAALQGAVEQSLPGDVVPLKDLLTGKEFPFTIRDFTKLDTSDWEREDYLSTGKLVLNLIQEPDAPPAAVKEGYLNRLYILGLGPERRSYAYGRSSEFKSITEFQREIGSPVNTSNDEFAHWTIDDFCQYTRQLIAELGRLPQIPDYDAAACYGRGPSSTVIQARAGGVLTINERLGYPNISSWEDEDYIEWGVRVVDVNTSEDIARRTIFSPAVCDLLSQRRLGPSAATIIQRFVKWSNYKQQVLDEISQRTTIRQDKIDEYREFIDRGQLPEQYRHLTPDDLLSSAGRYLVAKIHLPEAKPQLLSTVTANEDFISSLRVLNNKVSEDTVKKTAEALQVHLDIWPRNDDNQVLKVTDNVLAEWRKSKIAKRKPKNNTS